MASLLAPCTSKDAWTWLVSRDPCRQIPAGHSRQRSIRALRAPVQRIQPLVHMGLKLEVSMCCTYVPTVEPPHAGTRPPSAKKQADYRRGYDAQGQLSTFAMPHVKLMKVMPASYISQGGCHAATAIVALTHDPRLDDLTLLEAVRTPAFYIGAMGSRRTSEKRMERVRRIGGLDDDALDRIHAPIGLKLGSKTPAEIALAVMADIVRVSNGVSRAHL